MKLQYFPTAFETQLEKQRLDEAQQAIEDMQTIQAKIGLIQSITEYIQQKNIHNLIFLGVAGKEVYLIRSGIYFDMVDSTQSTEDSDFLKWDKEQFVAYKERMNQPDLAAIQKFAFDFYQEMRTLYLVEELGHADIRSGLQSFKNQKLTHDIVHNMRFILEPKDFAQWLALKEQHELEKDIPDKIDFSDKRAKNKI